MDIMSYLMSFNGQNSKVDLVVVELEKINIYTLF
jgi:hypothetical protein